MSNTPNLTLPYIAAAQAQKHVTHNEALRVLDAVVQLSVLDRDLTTPPVMPAEGGRYIVAASATGVWTGRTHQIAAFQDGAWVYFEPRTGWLAWISDEAAVVAWDGSDWVTAGGGGINPAPAVGVNTTADTTNKLAVKSDAVLFTHDDVTPGTGHIRATLNKSAAVTDAGFTFQDAFSTRALLGLLGDDDFTLKVSPNGSTFYLAVSIDKDTGHVGLNGFTADANNGLGVKGTAFLFDAETDHCRFTFNKAAAGNDAALTFQTGYSARTLIGLLGNDNFTFKVSPDGSAYKTSMIIENSTGKVSFDEHPKFSAYVNFDKYIAAGTWTDFGSNDARHNDQGDWSAGVFTAPHAGYYLFGTGYRFKANSTVPTDIQIGLSVNNATPLSDRVATSGDAAVTTLQSFVQVTSLIKLAAADTVRAMAYMTTNDGYVEANSNFFWGCQIA